MNIQKLYLKTIYKVLRVMVRFAIKKGVPCKLVEEVLRYAYVDEATINFKDEKGKITNSKIAVLTGLSRKEVLRIKETPLEIEDEDLERFNRCKRVVTAWRREPKYCDSNGDPMGLEIDGEGEVTFKNLVKEFSGDMLHTAVLDELLEGKNIQIKENFVFLKNPSYISSKVEKQALAVMGEDGPFLLETIQYNIEHKNDLRFQRKVSYNNIPPEVLPKFKQLVAKKTQLLLEDLDEFLDKHQSESEGDELMTCGLSAFYYEKRTKQP